jgi:ribokinase
MSQKVINFGSLNIDHVYQVAHIVRPGETISSSNYSRFCGGKGGNQSIALARAEAQVLHAGQIGPEGTSLVENLKEAGAETQFVKTSDTPTGHAIIQVSDDGENSIVLYPGANRTITSEHIDEVLSSANANDIMLLQNEINGNAEIIEKASAIGMLICLNPAPFDDSIKALPLEKVSILVLNETEGTGLAGTDEPESILNILTTKYPHCEIILTLGSAGVIRAYREERQHVEAIKVKAIDTTAAGDTFIGYYLACKILKLSPEICLKYACRAAAITVTRPGAADSIPTLDELKKILA